MQLQGKLSVCWDAQQGNTRQVQGALNTTQPIQARGNVDTQPLSGDLGHVNTSPMPTEEGSAAAVQGQLEVSPALLCLQVDRSKLG